MVIKIVNDHLTTVLFSSASRGLAGPIKLPYFVKTPIPECHVIDSLEAGICKESSHDIAKTIHDAAKCK